MSEESGEPAEEALGTGLRRLTAPRHSAAALRAARSRGGRRSILVALIANVAIAAAKLAAGLITGSSALLAEAAHSAADSVNEVLLGLSLRRARRPADATHPFGYGATRFLWAFLAALFSFLVGGCVSVALAVHQLATASHVDQFLIGWVVLAVAFAADGSSLLVSLRATRREAALWNQKVVTFLRRTSDPTLRALVVEDSAALVGVALAAGGLLFHQVFDLTRADAIASLLIGLLLAATAVGLAQPLAELLIGESMQPARLAAAYDILAASLSFDAVLSMRAVHVGPQEVVVAAKVHPRPGQTGEQLAAALDELDHALRESLPEIAEVYIDLTSYSLDESRE
jgi:cation diffusion facilitator family transporter